MFERIKIIVIDITGISFKDIVSPSRKREVVAAKQILYTLASKYTKLSMNTLALELGDAGHSNAIHSVRAFSNTLYQREEPYYTWYLKCLTAVEEYADVIYNPEQRVKIIISKIPLYKNTEKYYVEVIRALEIDLRTLKDTDEIIQEG